MALINRIRATFGDPVLAITVIGLTFFGIAMIYSAGQVETPKPAIKVRITTDPGETFVEYQLRAQQFRPDRFVMTVGYGDAPAGYIPTEQAVNDGFMNGEIWCWVAPDAPRRFTSGLTEAFLSVGPRE